MNDFRRLLTFFATGSLLCVILFGSALATAQEATGQELAEHRFDVFEYVVEGNTVLPSTDIERAVYAFLGPQRNLQDVERARAALEKTYQDQGYLTVSVELPEQKVDAGEVKLLVVEGSVEKLRVTGAQYHLPSTIRKGMPSLAQGNVPQFAEVQEELTALGRQPDRRITPLLRPGKVPGKLEVELQVEDHLPLHGSVELNNKQSTNTVEGRIESALRYDNLFQSGHSLGFNWIVAPENRDHANILSVNYGVPFKSGDYASAFFTRSDSNTPTGQGGPGGTVVKGTSVGLRYRFALPVRGSAYQHGLSLGVDHRDNEDISEEAAAQPTTLKYLALAARYDQTRLDSGDDVTTAFDANLSLGLRGLSDRSVDCPRTGEPTDQFECSRANAKPNFMVWRFAVDHARPLWGAWRLRARAEGQWASGALVSQEQFGAGGSDSVRGYYDYEEFGDHGVLLRLETVTPVIAWLGDSSIKALGFAERSQLWKVDTLPAEEDAFALGSVGLGLRAESRHINGRLEWGYPLFGTQHTRRHDGRAFVSLKFMF